MTFRAMRQEVSEIQERQVLAQARLDELATKINDGQASPLERAEGDLVLAEMVFDFQRWTNLRRALGLESERTIQEIP